MSKKRKHQPERPLTLGSDFDQGQRNLVTHPAQRSLNTRKGSIGEAQENALECEKESVAGSIAVKKYSRSLELVGRNSKSDTTILASSISMSRGHDPPAVVTGPFFLLRSEGLAIDSWDVTFAPAATARLDKVSKDVFRFHGVEK
jgi:hypothetical protein